MRFLLFLAALVAGCTPIHDQVLTLRDGWTGASSLTVQEREIFRGDDAILTARPIILTGAADTAHGVMINFRRQDANGPRIMRITSLGYRLPYHRLDRLRTHCIDGCQSAEVGFIVLSPGVFAAAANTGLPLRVWGQRGRAEGVIPAEAFRKVWAAQAP